MLGLERNQGWRAVRRGNADDAAGWFVSIGRLWRERGGRCGEICSDAANVLQICSDAAARGVVLRLANVKASSDGSKS